MTQSLVRLMSGAGLLISVFITPAYSATFVNGGVIHFQGAVVADPCEITPQHRQLTMSCPENNRMQTRSVSYEEALNGSRTFAQQATVNMKYLNPEKTLAVVQIDYQ